MTNVVRVAGVDGCRSGWVVVTVGLTRRARPQLTVHTSFADVRAWVDREQIQAIGVDMPIGLPVDGRRSSDSQARSLLGPRRSSLFPTPAYAVLGTRDWTQALERSRQASGKGISKQAFYLMNKVSEVRSAITPEDQPRFSEVHPETSFAVLSGRVLAKKKSPQGQQERTQLVTDRVASLRGLLADLPPGCAADDALDACAAAWTARRMAKGQAQVLGNENGRDPDGYRLTITV